MYEILIPSLQKMEFSRVSTSRPVILIPGNCATTVTDFCVVDGDKILMSSSVAVINFMDGPEIIFTIYLIF